jgi:molybdopterin molybdotransferase
MPTQDEAQRIIRFTPVEDVLARIEALVEPVAPRELDLEAALSCVLARDVSAGPRPRSPVALRDGWAVEAALTADAGSYAPVPLERTMPIDAGEPLPAGADAVAPLEVVRVRGGLAEALAPVVTGEGVLPAAADADPQRPLLRAGRRLTAVDSAVLTGAGIVSIWVRAPRVAVARARPKEDHILDATSALIDRFLPGAAAAPSKSAAADLATALNSAAADAVIAIGGTGAGRNDSSVRTLAAVGRVEVHGVALSPGETTAFGFVGARPVLLIPGRLDAALAVWLTIGRALVARLCGASQQQEGRPAVLARKIASPLGVTELVPVRRQDALVEPLASGYWPLQTIANADGWIEVPPSSEGYPAGAEVMVRPWP